MSNATLHNWLARLGFSDEPNVLHLESAAVPDTHPYALEIKNLLRVEGTVRAQAVFDVEGVPTVVFIGDDERPLSSSSLDAVRQKIWNQNLATIVVEIKGERARVLPARKSPDAAIDLTLAGARADGEFSALDIASANLVRRFPAWFDIEARVDRKLLANLSTTVETLTRDGFTDTAHSTYRRRAELLMGQILFVSYLEHRDIVGSTYRSRRAVAELHRLVATVDRSGVRRLIDALRQDFNGDFLADDRHDPWASLGDSGFVLLDQFLRRTDMTTGQGDFWNYDFSYIPVELLSGLYESFLSSDQQARDGAYYTPRHLAMLAVDQALVASADPLNETIFDGACGSGILLTTAYRRLIALAEARQQDTLSFKARRDLLVRSIFGGDINEMACRVTAFSLYLSLLEGLAPTDILEAQDREKAKLPTLAGKNLHHGEAADIFKPDHAFAGRRFSLIISNPPWKEPSGAAHTSADTWAREANAPFVRRQIAGAYALRALDFLGEHGRLCLVLPIGQFLASTSAAFVSHLLQKIKPTRLINFGDLQNLLFPSAEHTCHLFVGTRRGSAAQGRIPFGEVFDYLVPKADMSLAYGRLTMQSADRHSIQTQSVAQDPSLLVTLMWGDANDLTLWTRLSAHGTFGSFWSGPRQNRRWTHRKGVHLEDRSRQAVSSAPLRRMPFVPVEALSAGSPVLHDALLKRWDAKQSTVASANDDLLRVFDGPRVMFPDGFSREELSIRAVYYEAPASFTHSIGVVAGPVADRALLQFTAAYLRSSLGRYFLMMRGWKMLCERNAVHLTDIEAFPFFSADEAPNARLAKRALARVSERLDALARLDEITQRRTYETQRDDFDADVFDYFDLSTTERELVRETVEVLMPSIRPRGFASLNTVAQKRPGPVSYERYATALGDALTEWRQRTGGTGRFVIEVITSDPGRAAPIGIVRVTYKPKRTGPPRTAASVDTEAVLATLAELRRQGLTIIPAGDALQLVPDVQIWLGDTVYLARPLTQRGWSLRQALRDAERIVRTVQDRQSQDRREVA